MERWGIWGKEKRKFGGKCIEKNTAMPTAPATQRIYARPEFFCCVVITVFRVFRIIIQLQTFVYKKRQYDGKNIDNVIWEVLMTFNDNFLMFAVENLGPSFVWSKARLLWLRAFLIYKPLNSNLIVNWRKLLLTLHLSVLTQWLSDSVTQF